MSEEHDTPDNAPRFAADVMLGRLARYLRLLGFDTIYDPSAEDAQLVAHAAAEGRVLLTRDRRLIAERRPARAVLVEGDDVLDQLHQLVAALDLAIPSGSMPRCSRCNAALRPVARKAAARRVPERVRRRARRFAQCAVCGRVYWEGSHMAHLRARIARALGDPS